MQYGDPTTSALVQSGSADDQPARRSGFDRAISRPDGLRAQTPISQTTETPSGTTRSHSGAGTDAQGHVGSESARHLTQPDRRVDLVHDRDVPATPPPRAGRSQHPVTAG